MSTEVTTIEPDLTDLPLEWEDVAPPCDLGDAWRHDPHAEARWIVHRKPCEDCGFSVTRLICNHCKDQIMAGGCVICSGCDRVEPDLRKVVSSIQAIH